MDYLLFDEPLGESISRSGVIIERTFDRLNFLDIPNFFDCLDINRWLFFGEQKSKIFLPVGFSGYSLSDGELYLRIFQINPSDQRKGIGREALDYLLKLERPSLVKLNADYRSKAFWTKLGFLEVTPPESDYAHGKYELKVNY